MMPDLHLPFSEMLPLEPDLAKLDESGCKQLIQERKNRRVLRKERREKRVIMDAASIVSNSFVNDGATNVNQGSGYGTRQ